MTNAEGYQQQLEERAQTECPACGLRPVGTKFVWVKRGNYYHRELRCDECHSVTADMAIEHAIKFKTGQSYHHSLDRAPDGRSLYIGTVPYEQWCRNKEPK